VAPRHMPKPGPGFYTHASESLKGYISNLDPSLTNVILDVQDDSFN